MPKHNIYPSPSYPGAWDEQGATRRIELGWGSRELGGGVQLATTVLRPGADRRQDYVPDPANPDGPHVRAWDGWFIDLDRPGINELIRALREARDKAYGRDE